MLLNQLCYCLHNGLVKPNIHVLFSFPFLPQLAVSSSSKYFLCRVAVCKAAPGSNRLFCAFYADSHGAFSPQPQSFKMSIGFSQTQCSLNTAVHNMRNKPGSNRSTSRKLQCCQIRNNDGKFQLSSTNLRLSYLNNR